MKNKALAIIACLVLVVAMVIPGTLAVSVDETSVSSTLTVSDELSASTSAEEAVKTCTCDPKPAEGEAHQEGCPLYVAPEQPAEAEKTCTCDPKPAEGEAHQEGCPLYAAPEQPAEPVKTCTCDPKPAEGEAHQESCPLYVAPEQPAKSTHIDGCSDDCTDENCKCSCHLFKKIMACTTLDEIWAVLDETPDEAFDALTDEQNVAIDAKIAELEPAPAPAIVVEQSTDETVPSEIVYPTVNYTYVAPFGEPVTGGHN